MSKACEHKEQEKLKSLIKMLQGDIDSFGAGGNDLQRLKAYKNKLKSLLEADLLHYKFNNTMQWRENAEIISRLEKEIQELTE